MTSDVESLIAQERLPEAAELLAARGEHARASVLFERACAWQRAAELAVLDEDFSRALELAIMAKNERISSLALGELGRDHAAAVRCAERLALRGDHAWAARLFEAGEKKREAALEWNRAGDAARASEILEANGEPAEAARLLEAALRRSPSNGRSALALGGLLLRYGKIEAAVRTLQSIAHDAPERGPALALIVQAFDQMGLSEASRHASEELTALGGVFANATPTAARVETKARLFGRYDVVREVASTASARVLECSDVVRHETVAMKLFSNEARAGGRDALSRFEREIKALAAIDHPNVVPMRDYFPDGPALVMEWMSGGTLEEMIKRTTITPARAVEIARAVLSALAEAHRVEILHRDVKPGNVLFDGAGVTRLGDFGVAHLGDLSATATAGVIGTVAYMSPEQRRGEPATVESDIYGVGAMLFEMLTGQLAIDSIAPRRLPSGAHRDLDARHDRVVLAMLDDDLRARPRDALEARRALAALPWPTTVEPAAPVAHHDDVDEDDTTTRLRTNADGSVTDVWIGRPIERLALDAQTTADASFFARAGHPSLQTIFRVDRTSNEIWLEQLTSQPANGREIEPNSRADLMRALESVRAIGGGTILFDATLVGVRANGELAIRLTAFAAAASSGRPQGSTMA